MRLNRTLSVLAVAVSVAALAGAAVRAFNVRISSPRNNATVTDDLRITGTSNRYAVNITGFVDEKKVFSNVVVVRGGRWELRKGVSPGSLRIRATDEDSDDEVTVTVIHDDTNDNIDKPDWDNNNGTVSFSSPRDNAVVREGSVRFSGRAKNGTVRLQVFRGRDRVYDGDLHVRNGSWSQSVRLSEGSHRATIEQDRRRDTLNFRVGEGNSGTTDTVVITTPRDGATVGRRVTFSGTTTGASVGVQINKGKMRVSNSSQKANRGRWTFSTNLDPGTYQVIVNTGSAKDQVTIRVR